MLTNDSRVIRGFKGMINGVVINREADYHTLLWFLGDLEDILFKDTLNPTTLTDLLAYALDSFVDLAMDFDRVDLEDELHNTKMEVLDIQEGADYYEVIPPYYFEEAFKYIQEHMVLEEE